MLRSILGIVLGILIGGLTVGLIEFAGNLFHPMPAEMDRNNWDAVKSHAAKAPLAAHACVAIGWTIGPLVGAWIAAMIARRSFLVIGLTIGIVFLLCDLAMILSLPTPLWLAAIGILAPLISAWLGASLAARMSRPTSSSPQPYDMRREKNMAC